MIFFCQLISSGLDSDKAMYVILLIFLPKYSANSLFPLFVPPVINMILDEILSLTSIKKCYLEKYHHVASGINVAATNKPITI